MHEKLVNVCNESGKTVNEMLNVWIKEQSDLMSECISKDKQPGPRKRNIDYSNLESWVAGLKEEEKEIKVVDV